MDSPKGRLDDNRLINESTGQPIKSQPAVTPAHIIYVNKSGRTVAIYWIDYSGSLVKFASLDHGKLFRIKTFIGHPWIACSEKDGKRMQFYYQQKSKPQQGPNSTSGSNKEAKFSSILWPASTPNRTSIAFILSPVYTLKEVCFRHLQILGVSYDSASKLRLPRTIFEDLVEFANLKMPQSSQNSRDDKKEPTSESQDPQD